MALEKRPWIILPNQINKVAAIIVAAGDVPASGLQFMVDNRIGQVDDPPSSKMGTPISSIMVRR